MISKFYVNGAPQLSKNIIVSPPYNFLCIKYSFFCFSDLKTHLKFLSNSNTNQDFRNMQNYWIEVWYF